MLRRPHLLAASALLATLAATGAAAADSASFDLGVRGSVLVGDGHPANDVLGAGLSGRWWLSERWGIGLALDHVPEFDVERTAERLGIDQDAALEVIDNKGTATSLQAWIERRYGGTPRRAEWFWGLGIGLETVDVDDALGRTSAGAPLRIVVDGGTQPLVTGLGGVRWRLGRHWQVELALRAEQHFADWTVEDLESGRRSSVSDYLLTGVSFGVSRRF